MDSCQHLPSPRTLGAQHPCGTETITGGCVCKIVYKTVEIITLVCYSPGSYQIDEEEHQSDEWIL